MNSSQRAPKIKLIYVQILGRKETAWWIFQTHMSHTLYLQHIPWSLKSVVYERKGRNLTLKIEAGVCTLSTKQNYNSPQLVQARERERERSKHGLTNSLNFTNTQHRNNKNIYIGQWLVGLTLHRSAVYVVESPATSTVSLLHSIHSSTCLELKQVVRFM